LYVTLTPPWQNPDEPAHFNYIRAIADQAVFPELTADCYDQGYLSTLTARKFPKELSLDRVCYEFHQPPTYYILAGSIFRVSDRQLIAVRALSVLLGAGIVSLSYLIGRSIFPGRPDISLGGMAFVAFVPMHVAILSSVNNDSLASLCFAAILLALVRRLKSHPGQPTLKNDILLGILLGLALVTKTTIYIAIPLVACVLIFERARWKQKLLRPVATVFGLALLIALPWYIRNLAIYGNFDILGLARHDKVVTGQLRTTELVSDIGLTRYFSNLILTTFQSFWGQFGWMAVPMDTRTYRLLLVLVLVALFGFVAFIIRRWRDNGVDVLTVHQRYVFALLALSMLFTFTAYAWYNFSFVQFQGRYLFTAVIPLGVFFAVGLAEATDVRWQWWLLGGLVLASTLVPWQMVGFDKWGLVITAFFLAVAVFRIIFSQWASEISKVLLICCYVGLAALTLMSPFWFIKPYL
jgi:4-amino-4-deoxy-L-arabinose transferase-like glycosyltransferase